MDVYGIRFTKLHRCLHISCLLTHVCDGAQQAEDHLPLFGPAKIVKICRRPCLPCRFSLEILRDFVVQSRNHPSSNCGWAAHHKNKQVNWTQLGYQTASDAPKHYRCISPKWLVLHPSLLVKPPILYIYTPIFCWWEPHVGLPENWIPQKNLMVSLSSCSLWKWAWGIILPI